MNNADIQKYFRGEATDSEVAELLDWIDASEENRRAYNRERQLFDAALFAEVQPTQHARFVSMVRRVVSIAAAVAAVVVCTVATQRLFFSGAADMQQTIATAAGQRAQVTLPDGSNVWLNSNTILTYNSTFGRGARDVSLNGEAYFEVAKNKSVPFNVLTENNRVKVVGTHFNVCAYKGSNRFEATLSEGCVDVFSGQGKEAVARLAPNEMYSEKNGVGAKQRVDADDVTMWREGVLRFDDVPFTEMVAKLGLHYGINIIVADSSMRSYRCTGKFKSADGIEHILSVVQKDRPFHYVYDKVKQEIIIR